MGADQIHFAVLAPKPPPHGASPLAATTVAALQAESSKSTAVQLAAPASASGTDVAVRHVASVITSGATPPSESTVSWPMMPRSLPPWLDVFVPRTAMTFLRPGWTYSVTSMVTAAPQLVVVPTLLPLTNTSHSLS